MNGWEAIAETQYGVITRAQLRAHMSDRQIHTLTTRGTLERVHTGVFRVGGSFRSARQRAAALILWCGDDALLSHDSAAALLKLPVRLGSDLHVTVPRSVKRVARSGIVIHRTVDLGRQDCFVVDGLPCTSATRTIIDLASQLDAEALKHAFDAARRVGFTTILALERRLGDDRVPASLRELLRVVDARPTESRLEVRTARLLRKYGITPEAKQHRVGEYRIDFVLSIVAKLGLECDGFEWHGNRLAWKRDRRRIAALETAGWRIVHVAWDDVTLRPSETISRLRRALPERTTAAAPRIRAVHGRA